MDLVVELRIRNLKDWDVLLPLLRRLKIPFSKKEMPSVETETEDNLKVLQAMLAKGIDASYFGDPVDYQRDVRSDSEHPLRS